jgi:hypothetical protein
VIQPGQGHITIAGLTVRHMPRHGLVSASNTRQPHPGLTIRDCVLHHNGRSGLRLAAVDGFLVEGVEAYANGHCGLEIAASDWGRLSPANGQVLQSSFHDHTGDQGHGLVINQGHDISVVDSQAYHNRIHGFDLSDRPKGGETSHHVTFEGNRAHDNGLAGFSINSNSHHVVFARNTAWRNGAAWAGEGTSSGFLCYESCWQVQWRHNTSTLNSDAGFAVDAWSRRYRQPSSRQLTFHNNIAFRNGLREWELRPALRVQGEGWAVVATHNNWAADTGIQTAVVSIGYKGDVPGQNYTPDQINSGLFQEGNMSLNPWFADPTGPDVTLRRGSPCIDAGMELGQPYTGLAPDLGAREYQAGP